MIGKVCVYMNTVVIHNKKECCQPMSTRCTLFKKRFFGWRSAPGTYIYECGNYKNVGHALSAIRREVHYSPLTDSLLGWVDLEGGCI